MLIKTKGLTGNALNFAVAKVKGWKLVQVPPDCHGSNRGEVLAPPDLSKDYLFPNIGKIPVQFLLKDWCGDWAFGGPLIDEYSVKISYPFHCCVAKANALGEKATLVTDLMSGKTTLEAICRAVVYHHLGEKVEIPDEIARPNRAKRAGKEEI